MQRIQLYLWNKKIRNERIECFCQTSLLTISKVLQERFPLQGHPPANRIASIISLLFHSPNDYTNLNCDHIAS